MKTAPSTRNEQRSLFGEILDWMLTPLLILWPISLVLTWMVAQNIAGKPFDRALEYSVGALAQLVRVQDKRVQFEMPRLAHELLQADDAGQVYYQVRGARGEHLSGEPALPAPPSNEAPFFGKVRFRDASMYDGAVRIAYTWIKLDIPGSQPALVQVAETPEKRAVLASEIVKGVMLPQFIILPLAILLVWMALIQAIKPLKQLERRIRARKPDDLSPIDVQAVPREVAPVVASINDLLMRLEVTIATQRRFLANAAHQLKTPLAGLRMQADLALREGENAQELKQSLRQIGRSSIRATRTVNQLLALARAESSDSAMPKQTCDLVELTQAVVRDCVPRALEGHLDLGYEGPQAGAPHCQIKGNPTLLKELIRNLLDNAISYTPSSLAEPGVVTARVLTDPFGQTLLLQVEDSGPGVSVAERELIFQPFYRALGTQADGTGLGLPIVMEIAHQHSATVSLADARPGHVPPGTCFSVRFPSEALTDLPAPG